jgi:hypothetical protein
VAVAAVDADLRVTDFSCGHANVDGEVNIAAPGEGILSAYLGNTTEVFSGTSQAAAFAGGIAALHSHASGGASGSKLKGLVTQNFRVLQDGPEAVGNGLVKAPA